MTGFDKGWLPHTQQQETFHHHTITGIIKLIVQEGTSAERYPG